MSYERPIAMEFIPETMNAASQSRRNAQPPPPVTGRDFLYAPVSQVAGSQDDSHRARAANHDRCVRKMCALADRTLTLPSTGSTSSSGPCGRRSEGVRRERAMRACIIAPSGVTLCKRRAEPRYRTRASTASARRP
jgi:hypothetical protein